MPNRLHLQWRVARMDLDEGTDDEPRRPVRGPTRLRAPAPEVRLMPSADRPRPPLLFLSHAGIDTEAARALKQRLEAAPEARAHGLRVWFDQDDLRAALSTC